jgi:hypothetical protein
MIHPKDVYYTTDLPAYEYNLAKAQELLDQAGWKVQPDGLRKKDGKTLEFTIMTTSQNNSRELVQTFIQSELKKAGVNWLAYGIETGNEEIRKSVSKGYFTNDLGIFVNIELKNNSIFNVLFTSNLEMLLECIIQNEHEYQNILHVFKQNIDLLLLSSKLYITDLKMNATNDIKYLWS